jgi:hypothetical protein
MYKFVMVTVKGNTFVRFFMQEYLQVMKWNDEIQLRHPINDADLALRQQMVDDGLITPTMIKDRDDRVMNNAGKIMDISGYGDIHDIPGDMPRDWLRVRIYLKRRCFYKEQDMNFDWLVEHGYLKFF